MARIKVELEDHKVNVDGVVKEPAHIFFDNLRGQFYVTIVRQNGETIQEPVTRWDLFGADLKEILESPPK